MNKILNIFKHDNKSYMILSCMIVNNKIIPLSIAIK